MVALQDRMNALQTTWDTHTCAPPALQETSSLSEQLTTTLATTTTLGKHVSTARKRISELEALLVENVKKIDEMKKEIEKEK